MFKDSNFKWISLSLLLSSVCLFTYVLFPLFRSKLIRNAPIATKSIKDRRERDSVLFSMKFESSSLIRHEVNVERLRGTYAMRTLISNGSLSLSLSLQCSVSLFPYILFPLFRSKLIRNAPIATKSIKESRERDSVLFCMKFESSSLICPEVNGERLRGA